MAELKKYNVLKANQWIKNGQPATDQRGNTVWYLEIEGYQGKKIRAAKKPGNVAETGPQWGELIFFEDGNGKFSYKRPPEDGAGYQNPRQTAPEAAGRPEKRKEYQPKDEEAIRAMWAIGQAIAQGDALTPEQIEERAVQLFVMVDTVKLAAGDPMQNVSSDGAVELPPVENYDHIVTEEEMDGPVNLDDIDF